MNEHKVNQPQKPMSLRSFNTEYLKISNLVLIAYYAFIFQ